MISRSRRSGFFPRSGLILLPVFWFIWACHSYHIDTTVENRTGAAIELLEVDYPSASFGADRLAENANLRHRIQVRGSGPLKVQYTDALTHQSRQVTGPELFEGQEGQLELVLLPGGKAEIHPSLKSHQ
jgi:hypothetical protein